MRSADGGEVRRTSTSLERQEHDGHIGVVLETVKGFLSVVLCRRALEPEERGG